MDKYRGNVFDPISYIQGKRLGAQLADITNNGQIEGQIILTQAEYDALPSSKETDGIVYIIKGNDVWTDVTFINAWVNYDGVTQAKYLSGENNIVWLKGTIKSGVLNTGAFVLPPELRPESTRRFVTFSQNGDYALITIDSAGTVVPRYGTVGQIALDGIVFKTT